MARIGGRCEVPFWAIVNSFCFVSVLHLATSTQSKRMQTITPPSRRKELAAVYALCRLFLTCLLTFLMLHLLSGPDMHEGPISDSEAAFSTP